MKNKSLLAAILVFCVTFSTMLSAQSDTGLGSYLYYQGLINPAAVGSELLPSMNLAVSKKWVGFPGSPTIQSLNGSFRVGKLDFYNPKMFINDSKMKISDRIGIGLTVNNYSSGPFRNQYASGTYAYHIPLGSSVLSFGLSLAYDHTLLKESDFIPFQTSDPIIDYINESYNRVTTHTGVFWFSETGYIGLSSLNLLDLYKTNGFTDRLRNYWLIAGYFLDLNRTWTMEPIITVCGTESPKISFDAGLRMHYNSTYWVSINYNSQHCIHSRIAINTGRIHILYAFGIHISPVVTYQFGTHEIGVGFNPGLRKRTGNN
jgi:type IX secretion system PorP/SprF family membrane protein